MGFVGGGSYINTATFNFDMILNQNPIVNNRDVSRRFQFAIASKPRCSIDDIIAVPLSGSVHGVDQRNMLFVYAGSLPVGIGSVVV